MEEEALSPGARIRLALEMFESGVEIMRQNLRRRDPSASEEEIEMRLVEWLRTRPGAEHGDGPGKPRDTAEPAA